MLGRLFGLGRNKPLTCYVHSREKAIAACRSCQRQFCSRCLKPGGPYYYCSVNEACQHAWSQAAHGSLSLRAAAPISAQRQIAADAAIDRDVESLVRALANGQDGLSRMRAAQALAKIGGPAVEQLIDALHHESSGTRQQVAIALGNIGDSRATLPLVAALPRVGWAAAEALGKIGDPRAEQALVQATRDPSNPDLRNAARDALVKLRGSDFSRAIAKLIEKILTASAEAQVGEALAFAGENTSRPMSVYQSMEDAALELHRLRPQMTTDDREYLDRRLAELDGDSDWNVRRCAEIIRTGE